MVSRGGFNVYRWADSGIAEVFNVSSELMTTGSFEIDVNDDVVLVSASPIRGGGNTISVLSLSQNKKLWELQIENEEQEVVRTVRVSPNGRIGLVVRGPMLEIWDLRIGSITKKLKLGETDFVVADVDFSPDSNIAALSGLGDDTIVIVDLVVQRERLRFNKGAASRFVISEDGARVIGSTSKFFESTQIVFDIGSGLQIAQFGSASQSPSRKPKVLLFHRNGSLILRDASWLLEEKQTSLVEIACKQYLVGVRKFSPVEQRDPILRAEPADPCESRYGWLHPTRYRALLTGLFAGTRSQPNP